MSQAQEGGKPNGRMKYQEQIQILLRNSMATAREQVKARHGAFGEPLAEAISTCTAPFIAAIVGHAGKLDEVDGKINRVYDLLSDISNKINSLDVTNNRFAGETMMRILSYEKAQGELQQTLRDVQTQLSAACVTVTLPVLDASGNEQLADGKPVTRDYAGSEALVAIVTNFNARIGMVISALGNMVLNAPTEKSVEVQKPEAPTAYAEVAELQKVSERLAALDSVILELKGAVNSRSQAQIDVKGRVDAVSGRQPTTAEADSGQIKQVLFRLLEDISSEQEGIARAIVSELKDGGSSSNALARAALETVVRDSGDLELVAGAAEALVNIGNGGSVDVLVSALEKEEFAGKQNEQYKERIGMAGAALFARLHPSDSEAVAELDDRG